MKSEYVKLTGGEKYFGQNNLLQSELEILNLVKNFKNYKKLRRAELELKVGLKVKLQETLTAVEKLEKTLPKVEFKDKKIRKGKTKEELTIIDEMDQIKGKLERLQRGM